MQARERTTLTGQMLSNTSYGLATVWRCAVGLALVIVVTLEGTYQPAVRDASLTAAETIGSAGRRACRGAQKRTAGRRACHDAQKSTL